MGNVLVLGIGPLPVDKTNKLFAPGLRTWHLARLLASQRHRVTIGVIEFGDFRADGENRPMARREELGDRLILYRLKYQSEHTAAALGTLHHAHNFDCVVSTTDLMNAIATQIPARLPLWLDYNGDPFAEKQMLGAVHNSDAALLDQWRLLFQGLAHGDRFSTASESARWALIGQLGFAGRLTHATAAEQLVHAIMPCSRALYQEGLNLQVPVRSRFAPRNAFIVLWTGGYNTWCDPKTLFDGLQIAMRENPNVFYITTGGEIWGHNTETFREFRQMVEGSEFEGRFHFAGWVPTEHMRSYYEQADAAVNVDVFSYEGELGHRNRIFEWIEAGTPVVTTALCDFTRNLAKRDLVTTFEIGNPRSLADALLRVAQDPQAARQRAEAAKEFVRSELSEEKAYAPLLKWAANPVFAEDRNTTEGKHRVAPSDLAEMHMRQLERSRTRNGTKSESGRFSLKGLLSKLVGHEA